MCLLRCLIDIDPLYLTGCVYNIPLIGALAISRDILKSYNRMVLFGSFAINAIILGCYKPNINSTKQKTINDIVGGLLLTSAIYYVWMM